MHDWAGFHCHDGFWSRSAVAQFTVWSLGVVVYPPLLDQDLSLTEAVEDLAIEQFIPHRPLKLSQYPFSHALPGRASHGNVPRGAILIRCRPSLRRR